MDERKEHPIIFSSDMVKAILEGRKTQTRRVIKPQIETWKDCYAYQVKKDNGTGYPLVMRFTDFKEMLKYCPYGKVSDRLWVRETFGYPSSIHPSLARKNNIIRYKATDKDKVKWKSSLFMPKEYSRITLEITDIRVERLQEINEEDAKAEGIAREYAHDKDLGWKNYLWHGHIGRTITAKQSDSWKHQYSTYDDKPIGSFSSLWNSLAKKGFKWEDNPWVWVISFKNLKGNNE